MMAGLGFGMLGIGAFIMFAFWALVIGGAVWLIITLSRGNSASATSMNAASGQTPLDILRTRYAKGEINKEQFDQMKHDLGV